MTLRALVADQAPIWRETIARMLSDAGIMVVAQAQDAFAMTELAEMHRPDVVIADVPMGATRTDDGLRGALWIRRNLPEVAVLLLSQSVRLAAPISLLGIGEAGVGYLLKERVAGADQLVGAVREVAGGGSVIDPLVSEQLLARTEALARMARLTARELEVLRLLAQGRSNRAIASDLVITLKTVEAHIHTVLQKLGVHDVEGGNRRVHAVLAYLDAA